MMREPVAPSPVKDTHRPRRVCLLANFMGSWLDPRVGVLDAADLATIILLK